MRDSTLILITLCTALRADVASAQQMSADSNAARLIVSARRLDDDRVCSLTFRGASEIPLFYVKSALDAAPRFFYERPVVITPIDGAPLYDSEDNILRFDYHFLTVEKLTPSDVDEILATISLPGSPPATFEEAVNRLNILPMIPVTYSLSLNGPGNQSETVCEDEPFPQNQSFLPIRHEVKDGKLQETLASPRGLKDVKAELILKYAFRQYVQASIQVASMRSALQRVQEEVIGTSNRANCVVNRNGLARLILAVRSRLAITVESQIDLDIAELANSDLVKDTAIARITDAIEKSPALTVEEIESATERFIVWTPKGARYELTPDEVKKLLDKSTRHDVAYEKVSATWATVRDYAKTTNSGREFYKKLWNDYHGKADTETGSSGSFELMKVVDIGADAYGSFEGEIDFESEEVTASKATQYEGLRQYFSSAGEFTKTQYESHYMNETGTILDEKILPKTLDFVRLNTSEIFGDAAIQALFSGEIPGIMIPRRSALPLAPIEAGVITTLSGDLVVHGNIIAHGTITGTLAPQLVGVEQLAPSLASELTSMEHAIGAAESKISRLGAEAPKLSVVPHTIQLEDYAGKGNQVVELPARGKEVLNVFALQVLGTGRTDFELDGVVKRRDVPVPAFHQLHGDYVRKDNKGAHSNIPLLKFNVPAERRGTVIVWCYILYR